MPIAITEVQRDLRDSIRSRAAEFDTAEIRAGTSGNRWWKGLAEQGVFAVALPERSGGAGAGVAELAAALEPAAEALLMPDTALHSVGWLDELEQRVGKPVLTANQVTIWAALREMGLRAVAPEQRLTQVVDAPAA